MHERASNHREEHQHQARRAVGGGVQGSDRESGAPQGGGGRADDLQNE